MNTENSPILGPDLVEATQPDGVVNDGQLSHGLRKKRDTVEHVPQGVEAPSGGAPESQNGSGEPESVKTLKDQYLRLAADFDNYRKRMERERSLSAARGEDRVLLAILPILDNLQRAVREVHQRLDSAGGDGPSDVGNLTEGVSMVLRQAERMLTEFEVVQQKAAGSLFDPEFHEAVARKASAEAEGIVIEELQVGYMRHERLLRPSLVVVSSGVEA